MINGIENFYPNNNQNSICSICHSENVTKNLSKIRDKKLKAILSKINIDELINKCKCSNYENNAHKICLLLNIIFHFEIKCKQCKCNYNIYIHKTLNNSKKLCKFFSYLFLSLFHIILFVASVICVLYPIILNKDLKDNYESKKYFHLSIFLGVLLCIINIILMSITYSNFIDKNETNLYDYEINILDEKERNPINNGSDKYYLLLYGFYRYFYDTRIRYLINKKHKSLFFTSGYGNFNKEIKKLLTENNDLIEEDDILNLNKEQNINDKKVNDVNNEFRYTGTLGVLNNKKDGDNENIKNNDYNSYDKNSKNTNPINLQLSLIKKNYLEDNNSHKENMDDILIINNNLKSNRDKKSDKKSDKKTFNSISIYTNKKYNIISKSCFYKKLDQKKLLSKSKTYKTKSDRKRSKKEKEKPIDIKKNTKKIIKLNDSGSEKHYVDSTFLLKNENNKEKDKDKDNEKGK